MKIESIEVAVRPEEESKFDKLIADHQLACFELGEQKGSTCYQVYGDNLKAFIKALG